MEELKMVKSERGNGRVKGVLDELRKVAQGNDNLMPVILDAVRAYATLGEICDALRDVFGEYQPVSTVGG